MSLSVMAAIGVSGVDKVSGSASVKVEDQRKEIVVLNVGGKRFAVADAFVYILFNAPRWLR